MAHERKCMMCGTEYKYCSHCNDFDPTETWKYLYHDKKCMDISNIWYAYRGKEISKEDAKAKMSELKPNIDEVLKYTSIAAKEIRDIFDIKEEEPEEVDNESTLGEETKLDDVDAAVTKDINTNKHNKYQKFNYKNNKA